jgi:hypothetical protein
MNLVSTEFDHSGELPAYYTGDGQDVSPDLSWSALPAGTQGLALIVDDPDAAGFRILMQGRIVPVGRFFSL